MTSYLLLHGTPLTPAVWDGVAECLVDRCLRDDRPSTRTHAPALELETDDAGPFELARGVAAGLPEDLDGWHVVGHSFGGQVAIAFALEHPERVRRLTLLATRDSPFAPFLAAAERLRSGVPAEVDATLARWFRPDELVDPAPTAASMISYARTCVSSADPVRWARALAAIAAFDTTSIMHRIEVPTTVLAAELDQVSTVEAMRAMANRLAGSRFRVLDGAAHLSPFLQPDDLAALILPR